MVDVRADGSAHLNVAGRHVDYPAGDVTETRTAVISYAADLARSVVEGIALTLERSARALISDTPLPNELVAVGGGARSDLLLTALADLLDRPVVCTTAEQNCAALGAAALAFVGTGTWDDLAALQQGQSITQRYEPSPVRRRSYEPVRQLFEAATAASQSTTALRLAVVDR